MTISTQTTGLAEQRSAQIGGVLVGKPISTGTATGRARVVTFSEGAHVEPGDILVIPTLHASFMPLLRVAGGVITETASALSDPAIIARELRVPVVAGIERATDLIVNGEWVTVDGTAGVVRLDSQRRRAIP